MTASTAFMSSEMGASKSARFKGESATKKPRGTLETAGGCRNNLAGQARLYVLAQGPLQPPGPKLAIMAVCPELPGETIECLRPDHARGTRGTRSGPT